MLYNFYVEILELLFLLPRPLIIRFSIFRIEIIVLNNYSILMYVTFSTPCTSIFFPSSSSFHLASNCLRFNRRFSKQPFDRVSIYFHFQR